MAIVNRDLDSSQQNYVMNTKTLLVANGTSTVVGLVPSQGQILGFQISATGLSAAPVYQLAISRWTSSGKTGIALGSALTLSAVFGASGGAIGASFAVNGSLSAVQAGDLIVVNSSGGSGTAADNLIVSVVIQATQDIKKTFGFPV